MKRNSGEKRFNWNRINYRGNVMKEEIRKYKIISLILFLLLAATFIYFFNSSFVNERIAEISLPQLSTAGFAKVEKIDAVPEGDFVMLILSASCYELSASVEPLQAVSIQNGIDKKSEARPNAHDIAKDAFNFFGIKVLQVKITEQRGNSYFSKLILRQGNSILNLDARPSDAMAIAVRVDAPIYINETLLKANGEKVC